MTRCLPFTWLICAAALPGACNHYAHNASSTPTRRLEVAAPAAASTGSPLPVGAAAVAAQPYSLSERRAQGSRTNASRGGATREGAPARVDGSSDAQRVVKRSTGEAGLASIPAPLTAAGTTSQAATPPLAAVPAAEPFDDALVLAQASWLETGFSVPDGKALVGVMRSRARRMGDVSLAAAAYSYTAVGRGFGVARNDFGRALPDGDEPTWGAKSNARWKRLRAAVRAAVERRVGLPCRADHLGSRSLVPDVQRAARAVREGRWRPVACGNTVHAYYAIVSAAEAGGR